MQAASLSRSCKQAATDPRSATHTIFTDRLARCLRAAACCRLLHSMQASKCACKWYYAAWHGSLYCAMLMHRACSASRGWQLWFDAEYTGVCSRQSICTLQTRLERPHYHSQIHHIPYLCSLGSWARGYVRTYAACMLPSKLMSSVVESHRACPPYGLPYGRRMDRIIGQLSYGIIIRMRMIIPWGIPIRLVKTLHIHESCIFSRNEVDKPTTATSVLCER